MHLHYLFEKESRHLATTEGVVADTMIVSGEVVRGLSAPPGTRSSITLRRASEYPHVQAGADDIGLVALLRGGSRLFGATAKVTASFVSAAGRASRETTVHAHATTPLFLPSLLDLPDPFEPADLVIETDGSRRGVFIGSTRLVERHALLRLARGTGVEIGPGPKPQIHNSDHTSVIYVEEKPAENWLSTYKTGAESGAWARPNYRIGKANDLPVEDGSLDFIFSSHVLEHLHNPLGHFDHWRRKLKPGGLVLAVVPAVDGTKDFVLPPTSMTELMDEHRAGGFEVPLAAYERWVRGHDPNHPNPGKLAKKHYENGFSIHVHVYDLVSITNMLRRCVEAHGYSHYRIFYKRNAKDFLFALKANRG